MPQALAEESLGCVYKTEHEYAPRSNHPSVIQPYYTILFCIIVTILQSLITPCHNANVHSSYQYYTPSLHKSLQLAVSSDPKHGHQGHHLLGASTYSDFIRYSHNSIHTLIILNSIHSYSLLSLILLPLTSKSLSLLLVSGTGVEMPIKCSGFWYPSTVQRIILRWYEPVHVGLAHHPFLTDCDEIRIDRFLGNFLSFFMLVHL